MKRTKFILSLVLLSTSLVSLASCNSVSLAIKSKGEEVSAKDWAEKYVESYEENLDDFDNKVFSGYGIDDRQYTVSSSLSLKEKGHSKTETTIEPVGGKGSSKDVTNKKSSATLTYDIDNNAFKIKTDSLETVKTPYGKSYSESGSNSQYQKYQNEVYYFNLVDKRYTKRNDSDTVQKIALSNYKLFDFYRTIASVYGYTKSFPDAFGLSPEYKNSKFYSKGNVFTIVNTSDYKDSISAALNYKNIEGSVVKTKQFIFEKAYITITDYVEYKKCSYLLSDGKYKYTLNGDEGTTTTLKLKGSVSKVYVDDFSYYGN